MSAIQGIDGGSSQLHSIQQAFVQQQQAARNSARPRPSEEANEQNDSAAEDAAEIQAAGQGNGHNIHAVSQTFDTLA